jgi:hypothetical protein
MGVWLPPQLIGQVKMPSLLALNADHRAIGDFLVGLPVQRHPDRKADRRIISNDLNAANGFAPGPLSDGLQALLSESPVAHSRCFGSRRHRKSRVQFIN